MSSVRTVDAIGSIRTVDAIGSVRTVHASNSWRSCGPGCSLTGTVSAALEKVSKELQFLGIEAEGRARSIRLVGLCRLAALLEAADAARWRSSSDLAAELLQLGVLLLQLGVLLVDVAEEAGQNQHLLLMLPLDGREASMERELLVLKG